MSMISDYLDWNKWKKTQGFFLKKIMSIPLWVKFRNVLRYVFGFHEVCLKIWSCFPHSFSEQLKFHNEFRGNQDNLISVPIFRQTLIRLSWFPQNSSWKSNCSKNECGKQDLIFKHMSWKPNTYLKTLRNFTQRGMLMIFFKKNPWVFFTYFNQGNHISLTYQYKKIFWKKTILSPYMWEKSFKIRSWKWDSFSPLFIQKIVFFRPWND